MHDPKVKKIKVLFSLKDPSIEWLCRLILAVAKKLKSKKLKGSKKTQANFPKTQESANYDDRIPSNIWSIY